MPMPVAMREATASTPDHPGRRIVKGLTVLVLLGYPLAIYFAHAYATPSQMLAGLLLLLGLRALASAWVIKRRAGWQVALAVLCWAGAAVVLLAFRGVSMHWLKFYPMLFDLGVAAVFLGSLATGRPLIERIARAIRTEPLPPEGVVYTRRVTWAWGGLMVLIALVSLYTATAGSLRAWSLFNGLLVYVVIALAFALEYAVRCHERRKWRRHERLA